MEVPAASELEGSSLAQGQRDDSLQPGTRPGTARRGIQALRRRTQTPNLRDARKDTKMDA